MTIVDGAGPDPASTRRETEPPPARPPRRIGPQTAVIGGAVVLVFVSFVRLVTDDSDDLTSSGTAGAALRLAVPIMLAGLGGIYAERAGVVNIGLEGMMILGTWFGAWAGIEYGPWQGALIGALGGALGGLLHAIATVTFAVDHIVSGVAVNILAAGVVRFLSTEVFAGMQGGGATQSPRVRADVGDFSMPILSGGSLFGWDSPDLFGWMREKDWFLVSDVGGILGGLTRDLSLLTVAAFVLIPLSAVLLWRTPFGLRLRSAGENPVGAETLGVNVYFYKYVGVMASGSLAGLGGAFLVLEQAGIYKENMTAGRGFIGLAAMLFGNWMPAGLALGALLFGYADALQLRSESAVHALLLFIGLGAAVLAIRSAFAGRLRAAVIGAASSLMFLWWFASTDEVAGDIVKMTPYVTTLVVLAIATQRTRMPAADGVRWRPRSGV
ncbi:MAG: ABC transporter permease [Actinomycetota bacterium]